MIRTVGSALGLTCVLALTGTNSLADEYFVAATGKGKDATKDKPAKDLGNIVAKLKDGDVVRIASGTYLGREEVGADKLGVAVQIIGGYCEGFEKRDPWGACRTIFTGTNELKGSTDFRLTIEANRCPTEVVVDGIIFDNGPRNRYQNDKKLLIVRKADMGNNLNATPESGGVRLKGGPGCRLVVRNSVVMNTAPTGGAISVQPGQDGAAAIENNLVINNTGEGIYAMSLFHPRDGKGLPSFTITDNTVLFSWKHDAIATFGGNALKLDTDLTLVATGNVFGFGDYGGVDNIKLAKGITLKDNLLTGNRLYDYREGNTAIKVENLEDSADLLKDSTGNVSQTVKLPVGKRWAEQWAARKEVSRAEVDAKAKAANNGANALRGMLGLPLQANAVGLDADIWLNRLEIDEALPVGEAKLSDKYGCKKP